MTSRKLAERFRLGQFTASDLKDIAAALDSDDAKFLSANIFQYIKHVENLDEGALIQYLRTAHHAYPVSQIISGLSYRQCGRPEYIGEVLRFAAGAEWDNQDIVRLSALLALPRVTKCTPQIKSILRAAHQSNNPVVRDAALTSAQTYFGIAAEDIQWGKGPDDMTDKMPTTLLEWLEADAQ